MLRHIHQEIPRVCAAVVLGMGLIVVGALATSRADEPAAPAAAAKEPLPEEFKVPDGTPEELLKFMDGLMKPPADLETQGEEFQKFLSRLSQAVTEAGDKVLAGKPTNEQAAAALKHQLMVYNLLKQRGDKAATEQFNQRIAKYAKDPRSEVLYVVHLAQLQNKFQQPAPDNVPALQKFIREIWADLKQLSTESKPNAELVELTSVVGTLLDRTDQRALAIEAYRDMAKFLATSDDPAIVAQAEQFASLAKLYDLPGKPLEITGTLVNGTPFKWEDYKGKVVLVDFWATWCGPCRAELPNVKKNYETYHDQGFEVVGVSLDEDREQLETFLHKQEIPWPNLFSDKKDESGWNNPIAMRYGVSARGIPCPILVGRDGKVISISAHGEQLGEMLAELFPEAAKKAAK